MATNSQQEAIEILQNLGLKEYEAKSFVALSRMSTGTAKEISHNSDVPRTRVYDAIRVLESKGLVEVQHTNPQVFRAVSIDEAVETFRKQYDSRTDTLKSVLEMLEPVEDDEEQGTVHEVWSLSNRAAIDTRIRKLLDSADREVVVVLGNPDSLSEELYDAIDSAIESGVSVIVGVEDERSIAPVSSKFPSANVFVSELDWLHGVGPDEGEIAIDAMLLVDEESILVSTSKTNDPDTARAVFGRGFTNGLVVIARRMLATGLDSQDPAAED